LSFFTKCFKTTRGLSKIDEKEFIGYVIIKEDNIPGNGNFKRVYESVIKPSRYINNFIRGDKIWNCSVFGWPLKIKGYLYAQQNSITNVCAHVALRTVASCFHESGDMLYREMNNIIGIDHKGRKAGGRDGRGLDTLEMVKVLEASGAQCMSMDYTNPEKYKDQEPFEKWLYGSIESGFPAIVIFETSADSGQGHAIPIFGHTFNEDAWVHRAESSYFQIGKQTRYIPSESWVSMYIGHDDNWGSNFCIPRKYLHTQKYCDNVWNVEKGCLTDSGCVRYVIGTFPKEVQMNAVQAEVIGADYLFTILCKRKPACSSPNSC
jgi:hypothetical protein